MFINGDLHVDFLYVHISILYIIYIYNYKSMCIRDYIYINFSPFFVPLGPFIEAENLYAP